MRSKILMSIALVVIILGLILIMKGVGIALPQDGGLEGSFLSWGAGARSLGLGKAFIAMADDATASYWNPAGLARVDKTGVSMLHTFLWEGVTYDFISVAYPTLKMGTFGANVVALGVGGIERRDNENNVVGDSFSSIKGALTLSYGKQLFNGIDIGINVKYIKRWLDKEETGFITGDIGLTARINGWLRIGILGQHVAYTKYGDTDDALPLGLKVGVAAKVLEESMTIAGEIEKNGRWRVGAESIIIAPISLRLGLDGLEPAGGAGIKVDDYKLDYSIGVHRDLGISHKISLEIAFGGSMKEARMKLARESYDKALNDFREGKKEEALRAIDEVISLDSGNPLAIELKEEIKRGK